MAHRSSWPPVYPGLNSLSPSAVHHGAPRFPVSDTALLVGIAGSTAIITHLCQHAIHSAAEYARKHNITFASNEQFFEYLRQRSAFGLTPEADAHTDAGRGKGKDKPATESASQRPKSGQGVAGRGRA